MRFSTRDYFSRHIDLISGIAEPLRTVDLLNMNFKLAVNR